MSLIQYRINSLEEIPSLRESFGPKLNTLYGKVRYIIEQMKPGERYDFTKLCKTENDLELWIKCICIYIIYNPSNDVELSNDYSKILKSDAVFLPPKKQIQNEEEQKTNGVC